MKRMMALAVTLAMTMLVAGFVQAAEKAPQKVIDLAKSSLVSLGADPIIIKAVKAENSKSKTLDGIKKWDEKWKSTPGIADFMKTMMESECGKHLRTLQDASPYYAELFVMDNLGANVCMTDKTSDYWQGDEAKFTKSYKSGSGGLHISDVKFDDSTQVYVVQVSVPVIDGGDVIGAITVGIDVDKVE